ncbi:MAG: hypothetical protein ACRCV0_06985 [Brevinema sp.]
MSSQEIIDDVERREILRVLRSIIQEEDMFAKMMLGNCVKMLDQINDFAKRMELLRMLINNIELESTVVNWSVEMPLYFCHFHSQNQEFKILVPRVLYPKVHSYLKLGKSYKFKCKKYTVDNENRYKWVGILYHRGTA